MGGKSLAHSNRLGLPRRKGIPLFFRALDRVQSASVELVRAVVSRYWLVVKLTVPAFKKVFLGNTAWRDGGTLQDPPGSFRGSSGGDK
jgi:hypothetical protein